MDQKFIEKLTRVIEQNLEKEDFGVEQLARELGMSRITLHRKVKSTIKKSVSELIREIRLKHAYRLLQQKTGTISEIAFKVGFTSVSYFTRCFHKHYGYTPGEVIKGLHPEKQEKTDHSQKTVFTKTAFILLTAVVISGITAIMLIPLNRFSVAPYTVAVFPVEMDNAKNDNDNNFSWITIHIINKINDIDEISVVDYATVTTYPRAKKSPRTIAKELKVKYLMFPRVVQSGSALNIFIETVDAANGQSWSALYSENLKNLPLEEIPSLQEKIALNIIDWMEIEISPGEMKKIKQLPTQNKEAWEYYTQAVKLLSSPNAASLQIKKAIPLLKEAIKLDSTFTDAYSLMGRMYIILYYSPDPYLAAQQLSTAKIWLDRALKLDNNNYNALYWTKTYYRLTDQPDSVKAISQKLPKKVKNYAYYLEKIKDYNYSKEPYQKLLAFYKYTELKPKDMEIPAGILNSIYETYMCMGFPETAKQYANKFFESVYKDDVPSSVYQDIMIAEFNGNYQKVAEMTLEGMEKTFENADCPICDKLFYLLTTARCFMRNRDFEGACQYLDRMENLEGENHLNNLSGTARYYYPFGYSYLMNQNEEKGIYYLERLIKKYEDEIKLHFWFARLYWTHLELAMVWSAIGNTNKAFEYLYEIRDNTTCPLFFILELKNNPWFDNLRQSDEYEKIFQDFEVKYQKEHKRIAVLLKKNGEVVY